MPKQDYCSGCRQDFYNGNNPLGIKECWNLKDATFCTRYRIHWSSPMGSKKNYTKVKTLSCHSEPGHYAYLEKIPDYAT